MNNKLYHWFVGSILVFSSIICTSGAYADEKKDKAIFDDAYGLWPAALNPFGSDLKIALPDGMVFTRKDGSTSSAYLKDNEHGSIIVTNLSNNTVIAELPFINICLSVKGNTAYKWHMFTATVPGFCNAGDLSLQKIVINTKDSGTVIPIDVTTFYGVTSISGCGPQDDQYIPPGFPALPLFGVKVKDGI